MYQGYGIEASDRIFPSQELGTQTRKQRKQKRAPREAKADLLQTTGVPKTLVKQHARALDQMPPWDSLPICTHSKPNHDHLPKALHELLKRCEATSHHVDSDPCPVPGFFKLNWSDSLKCLYCERHQCLVPGEQIWTHLSRRHAGSWPNITRSTVLVGFLGHIRQCYPVIPYQHIGDVKNKLPDFLQEPLSSIPVIRQYKCPAPGCTKWCSINKNKGRANLEYKKHIRSHRRSNELSGSGYTSALSVESQWTQKINFGLINRPGCYAIVIVPHDPGSDTSDFPVLMPTVAQGLEEPWTVELGWDDELKRIADVLGVPKAGAVAKLRDLVGLPSRDRILQANNEVLQLVEKGLWASNNLNIRYFVDVISWIAEKHGSFRLLFGYDGFVP